MPWSRGHSFPALQLIKPALCQMLSLMHLTLVLTSSITTANLVGICTPYGSVPVGIVRVSDAVLV